MARTTLVTGASRRRGIGHAIVRRLLRAEGSRVVAHTWAPYDATEPWGADDPYRPPEERLTLIEADLDPDTLDLTWRVNVRAALLLVQAFAEQYEPGPGGGRVVLFTSGQHRGPMPDEIPYAATKGALHQLTATLADALVERGITVNCVNPGPTDTGWATPEHAAFVSRHLPRGRWNSPQEAADVVALLLDPAAATITGQVVDAEGGFRRFTP